MFHRCHTLVAKTIALTVGMLGATLAVGADAVEHRDGQQAPTHYSVSALTIPNVPLLRADGQRLTLGAALDDDRPVVLNFIYTSCNSICPLLSAVLAQFRDQLGAERASVHVVSISIDPEQDTPQELRAYAARFKGGPGWDYFTGSAAASVQVQRAFQIYRGEKMNHTPVTFIRPTRGAPWTRIDGFATAEQLLHSYHQLLAAR